MPAHSRHHRDKVCADRSGYTLIELLIALGILVAMTGLSLPAVRRSLDKGRLRSGAREVQAALAKTRSLAIRAGERHAFRYEIGGRAFRIETDPFNPYPSGGIGEEFIGTADVSGQAEFDRLIETPLERNPVRVLRRGQLPAGVVFAESTQSVVVPDGSDMEFQTAGTADVAFTRWSRRHLFRPDGRSVSATIRIQGSRDFDIEVTLRGLTGMAAYGAPQRQAVAAVEKPLQQEKRPAAQRRQREEPR